MNQRTPVLMPVKNLVMPVEVYSRIVGYFRPINQWNPGKIEEYKKRETFELPAPKGAGFSLH